jgi:hypothetical protein
MRAKAVSGTQILSGEASLGSSGRRKTPGFGGCDDYSKEAINRGAFGTFK